MVATKGLEFWLCKRRGLGFLLQQIVFGWWVFLVFLRPVAGLRPLRERTRSWGDEVCIGIGIINFSAVMIFIKGSEC